jgi:hypothetical protein
MECTVINFIDYKNQRTQEINLDTLKNTHLCTLASLIADELIIDKQLSNLQDIKTKESLIKVMNQINRHFNDKSSFIINSDQLHCIFKIIECTLENLLLVHPKKDTFKSKKLCALHEVLEPIYNKINPYIMI